MTKKTENPEGRKYAILGRDYRHLEGELYILETIRDEKNPDFIPKARWTEAFGGASQRVIRYDKYWEACNEADKDDLLSGVVPVDEGEHIFKIPDHKGEVRFDDPVYMSYPIRIVTRLTGEGFDKFMNRFNKQCEDMYCKDINIVGVVNPKIPEKLSEIGYTLKFTAECKNLYQTYLSLIIFDYKKEAEVFDELRQSSIPQPPYIAVWDDFRLVAIHTSKCDNKDQVVTTRKIRKMNGVDDLVKIVTRLIGKP